MGDVHSIEERRGVERGSEEGRSVKEQIQSLLLAAERGDVRGVRQLLEEGFDPNLQNGVGWTAMMHAAYKGELALARLLLEKGADPDRQSVSGWTALMSAACEGNREMVALLLENGAEPSVQDGAGRTALDLAVRHGRSDIADTLRKAMGVQSGFTLLELSMVLVIIGLIIGGITVGANLIRAGQLQSVTKDVERFQQAILDFRDKYQSLPGDMPNAESFWGSDSSCPPHTPLGPKTATCKRPRIRL